MADFNRMAQRVRRRIREDGTVVDTREPERETSTEFEGGRVLSLKPARVRLRGGETVDVDAYLKTGRTPSGLSVGADVVVVRRGGFVLVLGEVVML